VLEAYGCGRPVIGTDIGGIPELIQPGETGLVARAGDADDLAEKLATMAGLSAGERTRMGQTGRAWVARDFSPEAHRSRLIGLYLDLGVTV
jgi:glycosyltransferase involved in cell wall biosynthesis